MIILWPSQTLLDSIGPFCDPSETLQGPFQTLDVQILLKTFLPFKDVSRKLQWCFWNPYRTLLGPSRILLLNQGLDLNLDQGLDHNLEQDLDPDLDQDLDPDLDQGLDQDLDKDLDKELDQTIDQDKDLHPKQGHRPRLRPGSRLNWAWHS